MDDKSQSPDQEPSEAEALEAAKRIMKRLTEMPHKPHVPLREDGAPERTKPAKAKKGR